MSAQDREDFPPHWDPPPRGTMTDDAIPLPDVLDCVLTDPPAPWVRRVFLGKLRRKLPGLLSYFAVQDEAVLEPYVAILERIETEEWYDEDDYRMEEAAAYLRQPVNEDYNNGTTVSPELAARMQQIAERIPDRNDTDDPDPQADR